MTHPYRFSAYGVPGNLKASVYLCDSPHGDWLLATMTGLEDSEAIERWARSVLRSQSPRPVVQSSADLQEKDLTDEQGETMKKKVVRVTQSPMNAKRWVLDLECGHEKWITSARRPTRQWDYCSECRREAEENAK